MTNNVLPFHVPEGHEDDADMIMVCPCGGTTFYQHIAGVGNMECTVCGEIMCNDIVRGIDFQRIKDMESQLQVKRTISEPTSDLALARVISTVNSMTSAAVIVMDKDGSICTWSDNPMDEESRKWFRDQLASVEKLIC